MSEEKQKQKLIEWLKMEIAAADKSGLGLDEASWNYEKGILITLREAKLILNEITNDPRTKG